MKPEDEFDKLTKRWELARAQLQHENELINQRTNRIFLSSSFLLGAFGLLYLRCAQIDDPNEFVWAALLLLGIPLAGVLFTVFIQSEIRAAAQVVRHVEQWWEQALEDAEHEAAHWFPPFRFDQVIAASMTDEAGQKPAAEQVEATALRHFVHTRIVLPAFWAVIFLATIPWAYIRHDGLETKALATAAAVANQTNPQSASDHTAAHQVTHLVIQQDQSNATTYVAGVLTATLLFAVVIAVNKRLPA